MFITDRNGNSIESIRGTIWLSLKSGERRKIGEDKGSYIEMVRDAKHLMKKNNSYGFNYQLISSLDRDMEIRIYSSRGTYKCKTTAGEILDKGTFLHFLAQGFEKQIFLNLDLFTK